MDDIPSATPRSSSGSGTEVDAITKAFSDLASGKQKIENTQQVGSAAVIKNLVLTDKVCNH